MSLTHDVFVIGIGTDVGKTVVSAILVKSLFVGGRVGAYWKPVQTGSLEQSDALKVKNLVAEEYLTIYPETYFYPWPVSPNFAASRAGEEIKIEKIVQHYQQICQQKSTSTPMIVEGAGGLLSPINQRETFLDVALHLQLPVILVVRHYLGSLNHTLLTIECLRQYSVPILGMIFNGNNGAESEEFLLQKTQIRCLGQLDDFAALDANNVAKMAHNFARTLERK